MSLKENKRIMKSILDQVQVRKEERGETSWFFKKIFNRWNMINLIEEGKYIYLLAMWATHKPIYSTISTINHHLIL